VARGAGGKASLDRARGAPRAAHFWAPAAGRGGAGLSCGQEVGVTDWRRALRGSEAQRAAGGAGLGARGRRASKRVLRAAAAGAGARARARAGRGVGGWGAGGVRGSVDRRRGGRLGRPPIPTARLREGRKAEWVGSNGWWPGGLSGSAAAARGPDKGASGSELLRRGRPDRCTPAAARQARGPARGSRPNLKHTPPFAGAQRGAAAGVGILNRGWQQATPPKAVQAMGAAAPQRAGGGRARGRGRADGEWGLAGPQQVNGEQVLS
jgi:hypothetical protein